MKDCISSIRDDRKCLCGLSLVKNDTLSDCLVCPNKDNHLPYKIWVWMDHHNDVPFAINIRIAQYQVCFHMSTVATSVIRVTDHEMVRFDELLKIPFNKNALLKKIESIINFA